MAGRDPILLALILADNVVPDPNSGKNYILGTITQLFVRELPARMNQISLYIAIADARACRKPMIEVRDLQDDDVLISKELPPLPDRGESDTLELSISLGGVQFPKFGGYDFRVWMDGKFVGSRKFTVHPWPENK